MNELNVLRAVDYPRMPWKNGGGSTEEITRDAGEGLEGSWLAPVHCGYR